MIFTFADQNQQHFVLNLDLKIMNLNLLTVENWVRLTDGDADPFFIEISVSYFSIGTQEFCLPKEDDIIALEQACSSDIF